MSTLLEQRYRTVLRLLPAYYREAREEEMVETYLLRVGVDIDAEEDEDLDLIRPAWREVASVATLAVRSRMGAAGAPAGYTALGAAVQLFALFSVLLQATSTVTDRALALAWSSRSGENREMLMSAFTGDGVLGWARGTAMWSLPLLWTAVYVALLRQHRRAARVFAVLAAVAATVPLIDQYHWLGQVTTLPVALAAFAWLTVLAVCCGFHTDSAPARLPAVPPGLAFMGACVLMGAAVVIWPERADDQWTSGAGFIVAATACLAARAGARTADAHRYAAPALALAALGLALLTLRLGLLSVELGSQLPTSLFAGSFVQLAATAALTAALAAVGTRDLLRDLRTEPRTA